MPLCDRKESHVINWLPSGCLVPPENGARLEAPWYQIGPRFGGLGTQPQYWRISFGKENFASSNPVSLSLVKNPVRTFEISVFLRREEKGRE